jgi:hypothetical protein
MEARMETGLPKEKNHLGTLAIPRASSFLISDPYVGQQKT